MITPFSNEYQKLKAVGNNVLLEIVEADAKVGSIILANSDTRYAIVKDIGEKVTISLKIDDIVELDSRAYPCIKDKDGVIKYQIVNEERIVGVYSKVGG